METTQNKKANLDAVQAKLKSLGFKSAKRLGMNILEHEEGETVLITVTGPIEKFTSKKVDPKTKLPAEYDFVTVTNIETGETGMTYWLSGQIRYQFEQLDTYIGKSFAITSLGQTVVDGTKFNQFDIQQLEN